MSKISLTQARDFSLPEYLVNSLNYPDSDKVPGFNLLNYNFYGILSQVTEIGTKMSSSIKT